MGLFDRIILTIYTFALTFLSAVFLAMAAGWSVPLDVIRDILRHEQGRLVVGLTAGAFFVASVRLLYFAFRRRGIGQAIRHDTEMGEVKVSLAAIENLVTRVARQQRGIREVRPSAEIRNGAVAVTLRAAVTPDVSIPELSLLLQKEIARHVRNVAGVDVAEVRVLISNITSEHRRSRVE